MKFYEIEQFLKLSNKNALLKKAGRAIKLCNLHYSIAKVFSISERISF